MCGSFIVVGIYPLYCTPSLIAPRRSALRVRQRVRAGSSNKPRVVVRRVEVLAWQQMMMTGMR
jgi:hypothetical protein